MATLNEDLQYVRRVYKFPHPGDYSDPFGLPVRIITESFASVGDSGPENSARSNDYMIIPNSTYIARSLAITEFDYLVGGYIEWQDITARIGGADRRYIGYKQVVGRVTPAQINVLRQIAEGVGSIVEAAGNGARSALLYALSIISADGSVRNLLNQPFPAHHTGIIRMEARLKGISAEGGALDGNSVTMSNVDVGWKQEIMTVAYHEFMQARRIWNDFISLTSQQRRQQIRIFQGYLEQRNRLLQRRRSGTLQATDQFPPNPLSDDQVHPYIWWAWQRRLDPTTPPPDTRRFNHPGYDYRVKRSWWIDPQNGLPTE